MDKIKTPIYCDAATLERFKRGDVVLEVKDEHKGKALSVRQRVVSPIEYYYSRDTIEAPDYWAGVAMMRLYRANDPKQSVTAYTGLIPDQNYEKGRGDIDAKLDAGKALNEAEAILRPAELWVIRRICREEVRLETDGKNASARQKRLMLTGLRALCTHFKIQIK